MFGQPFVSGRRLAFARLQGMAMVIELPTGFQDLAPTGDFPHSWSSGYGVESWNGVDQALGTHQDS